MVFLKKLFRWLATDAFSWKRIGAAVGTKQDL
jgi:hypothetical protein